MNNCLLTKLFILVFCISFPGVAYSNSQGTDSKNIQEMTQNTVTVSGIVMDTDGQPLAGATILVKGPDNKGTVSDMDGKYTLSNVPTGSILEFSYIGFVKNEKKVEGSGKVTINSILYEDSQMLDAVEVVAFGVQKKESVIGAISTIKPGELKTPSSNLTTALAGRVAGMISYQRSGEPGADDASFFIRGVTTFGYGNNPLILIDNIEMTTKDLARVQADDIESFSIMKDATATALYGARGANGVILVKTKEGQKGKVKVSVRLESSLSEPTKELKLADPITYMRMHNEAILTRDPKAPVRYYPDKIANTIPGSGSYLYPYTDWRDELTKDFAWNNRVNLNVSGGGDVARYYVAASFSQDNGILNVNKNSSFNNNIDQKVYTLRSNVNIDLTKTTELIVRLNGSFEDYEGPIDSGAKMYSLMMRSNPVLFPAKYPNEGDFEYAQHTLFGNADNGNYLNPYAELVRGYKESSRSNMGAQFELKQDLAFITEGLSLRGLFNTSRVATHYVQRGYNPFFYGLTNYNAQTGAYNIHVLNEENGTEFLDVIGDPEKNLRINTYVEAAVNYNRDFGLHGISGLLVYQMNSLSEPNKGKDKKLMIQQSLPSRNVGVSGRATYSFDKRYFGEVNFGYNGSERFHKKHRWGFFPSAGLGWMIANEKFFENYKKTFNNLKLRASYGKVGNDKIGAEVDRFFYLSQVTIGDSKYGSSFGESWGYNKPGVSVQRYADPEITWETATKTNVALEVGLWGNLNFVAEYYSEKRKNILQTRAATPASMGLWAQPQANIGEAKGSGIDLTLDYDKIFRNGAWMQLRANFTYATNEYVKYEEKDYPGAPWRQRVGYPISQQWGYLAEGLFVDDEEVRNSPTQTGAQAGDIKYRDINRDGKIDDLDQVPIGYPTEPEIVYGFGASVGYKDFDFSVFFQGLARESFWIDYNRVSPFLDTNYGDDSDRIKGLLKNNQLAQFIANSYWSENNRDPYAVWPRLSDTSNTNNSKTNTWFMRDGSFLRLKELEVGYTLPEKISRKAGMKNFRVYLSGTNLLCFSNFKLWDPEKAGDGLGYPLQRVYNLGLNITF